MHTSALKCAVLLCNAMREPVPGTVPSQTTLSKEGFVLRVALLLCSLSCLGVVSNSCATWSLWICGRVVLKMVCAVHTPRR